MSHFRCKCGHIFHDNTDFLNFKAYFRADQDMEDFYCQVEKIIRNKSLSEEDKAHEILCVADLHYTDRILYQCPECGRIFIEDNKNYYHCFAPESEESSHRLLESAEGENWKGFLHAEWLFPYPEWQSHPGFIEVNVNSEEKEVLFFDDYETLRKNFYDLFQRLSGQNKLRSASLRNNKEWLFQWSEKDK